MDTKELKHWMAVTRISKIPSFDSEVRSLMNWSISEIDRLRAELELARKMGQEAADMHGDIFKELKQVKEEKGRQEAALHEAWDTIGKERTRADEATFYQNELADRWTKSDLRADELKKALKWASENMVCDPDGKVNEYTLTVDEIIAKAKEGSNV
jgi:hypothetical protein